MYHKHSYLSIPEQHQVLQALEAPYASRSSVARLFKVSLHQVNLIIKDRDAIVRTVNMEREKDMKLDNTLYTWYIDQNIENVSDSDLLEQARIIAVSNNFETHPNEAWLTDWKYRCRVYSKRNQCNGSFQHRLSNFFNGSPTGHGIMRNPAVDTSHIAQLGTHHRDAVNVPDLVERLGHGGGLSATTSGSLGQNLGSGGGGSGVRCKSEEALGTAGASTSGLTSAGPGDHDDGEGGQQRVEDDVTVEPFLHDPLDVKTHIQSAAAAAAAITSQAMISPLLSPPPPSSSSSSAAPLRLSQHHQLPPTTGATTNDSTEENNIQPESVSTRITSPPQPQGLAGPYLLKKETHCSTVLDQLLRDETFTDVTLTAEGQSIRAHRVVLCLASAYFRQVLSHDQNVHSVVILRDIKFAELKNIIHFIYTGEATVDASELESFMKTAEILEISSLCEGHKSISTAGLVSQSYGSGFNIGEFERLMGTKRNRKDAPPMPSKNRKISGEQSSRSSTPGGAPGTSVTIVKEEPIDHDSTKMHTDEPVYRGNGKKSKGLLEDSSTFGSKSLSTTFDTGEMEAMEEGSNSGGDGKSDTSGRSSPSATMLPDISTVPGRCPYCPHLNQEFRGVSMMRHLLVSHPCKPAFPCDNCFRVFVRKGQYKAHQAKCNDV